MKGEIDKDFYCSVRAFISNGGPDGRCEYGYFFSRRCKYGKDGCEFFHRKHPTPEQYKEEYGKEYPNDGAVYFWDNHPSGWWINDKENALANTKDHLRYGRQSYTVCACTPFGKPDKDWRPA
jgi:hypothetical protein